MGTIFLIVSITSCIFRSRSSSAAPCALVDDESYIPSNDVVVLVAPDMLSESGIQELNVIPSGTCQMQNSSGFAKEYPKYAIIDDEWIAQVQADTQAVENIKAQMQEAKNQIDQLLQNQPQYYPNSHSLFCVSVGG